MTRASLRALRCALAPGMYALGMVLMLQSTARAAVVMPLEVMGVTAATSSVRVMVAAGTLPVTTLQIEVNGIEYATQASVQVNGHGWTPLNNTTAQTDTISQSFGGIGGPIANQVITLPLASGVVIRGANTISFRFNGTDGVSSGYRVLSFNLLRSDGSTVLPASTFTQTDPRTWTGPFKDAASIAAGHQLWTSASLKSSSLPNAASIQAHCGDCHTSDGHDLKYFNFSNNSIIIRSMYHGMTNLQARQIASYIRSLPGSAPGAPWNPPYQPGAGLDAQPVASWAAGAGAYAVLPDDASMISYLFPDGIVKGAVSASSYLNAREMPISLPLPTWNQWLPTIHPKDYWGAVFTGDPFSSDYALISNRLAQNAAAGTLTGYLSSPQGLSNDLYHWESADMRNFIVKHVSTIRTWTPAISEGVYSEGKWHIVKVWEMMQRYQLEGDSTLFFGSTDLTEPRTWNSAAAFKTSPKAQGIPEKDGTSVGGKALTQHYFADAWYQLQFVLNPGNGQISSSDPIDWAYFYGVVNHTAILTGRPTGIRMVALMAKAMQEANNGTPPDVEENGWGPMGNNGIYVIEHDPSMWKTIPAGTQGAILTALLGAWLDQTSSIPVSDFYNVFTTSNQFPYVVNGVVKINVFGTNSRWVDQTAWTIINFRKMGADNTLCNDVCDWAQTEWPDWNWSQLQK